MLGHLPFTKWGFQAAAPPFRIWHDEQIGPYFERLPDGTAEILIEREQGEGLQFTVNTAEFLLNTVNSVKKTAAIHTEPAAAETPIRAQQKMKTKDAIFVFIQGFFADQTKVGNVIFVFSAPDASAVFTGTILERDFAHISFLRQAGFKACKTSPKNIA